MFSRVKSLFRGVATEEQATALPKLDHRIPPPEINYNQQVGDPESYARVYKAQACLKELPFLIRTGGLTPASTLFDYGCGLGRIAFAASNFLDTGHYYGYEPSPEALGFLKSAYADRSNFHFHGDVLRTDTDYVAVHQARERQNGILPEAIDLGSFLDRPLDLQYSHSVFTHMWQPAIVHMLKQFKQSMRPGAPCVNTWLIVDDFAAYAGRCGLTDRPLDQKINGAWSYGPTNPLMWVAYDLNDVREMYAAAGHEIVEIFWGSWSGRDNGVTFIDIVVSRPLPS
jgi:SAM-dependent methyltransferase